MHCDTFASVNNALLQMHCWLYSTHAQLGPEPRPNDVREQYFSMSICPYVNVML